MTKERIINWFSDDPFIHGIVQTVLGSDMLSPLAQINILVLGVVSLLGTALMSYNIVAGTLQTAHEGEVLGKRWSSVWVPVRVVFGLAALVPVGGICAIQILVLFVGAMGLKFGVEANKVAQKHFFDRGMIVSYGVNPLLEETTKVYARQKFCQLYFNEALLFRNTEEKRNVIQLTVKKTKSKVVQGDQSFLGGLTSLVKGQGWGGISKTTEPYVESYDWVQIDRRTGEKEIVQEALCGAIQWDQKLYNEPAVKPILNAHMISAKQVQENIGRAVSLFYEHQFGRIARQYQLDNPQQDLPSDYANAGKKEFIEAIVAYDANLKQSIGSVIAQLRSDSKKAEAIQNKLQQVGYLGAGAGWLALVQSQQEVFDAMDALPTMIPPLAPGVTAPLGVSAYERFMRNGYVFKFTKWLSANNSILEEYRSGPSYADVILKNSQDAEIKAYGSWVFRSEEEQLKSGIKKADETDFGQVLLGIENALKGYVGDNWSISRVMYNAPGTLMDFGNTLMKYGAVAYGGGSILDAITGFGAIGAMGATIAVFGALIANGIPWIVWAGWIFAYSFYLLSFVILLVGAVLWAIAHLHMDGDGFAGQRGGHGWNALIELFLKPVFQVFFLYVTFYFLPIILASILVVSIPMFDFVSGNTVSGFIGLVVMCSVIIFLTYYFVAAIGTRADAMMRLMGISTDNDDLTTPGVQKGGAALSGAGMYGASKLGSVGSHLGNAGRRNGGGGGPGNRKTTIREEDYLG